MDQVRKQKFDAKVLEAVVVDNNDPLKVRRLKVRVESVHEDTPDDMLPWAACGVWCGSGPNGQVGSFEIPIVGSKVSLVFQNGDPSNPLYTGSIPDSTSIPDVFKVNYPFREGFRTSCGTTFYVDNQTSALHLEHKGTTFDIDATGNVTAHIVGTLNATIDKTATINITGKVIVNAAANVDLTVGGNVSANVTGNVAATIGGTTNVTCSQSTFVGNLTVTKNVSIGGGLAVSGVGAAGAACEIAGTMHTTGIITADAEIKLKGINLSVHKHVETGGTTNTPIN